ncbi:retrovirus-related pol polyprotein from transposon TNT 1-94 [Tanacetum coccineum]
MSNSNTNLQTQSSNALHNAIMEAGSKDRPPMLALVPVAEGSSKTTTERYMENYKNVSQDIRDQLNVEAEAAQIILTGIDNDIYSTVDACPNACEMWKALKVLTSTTSEERSHNQQKRGKQLLPRQLSYLYDPEPDTVTEDDEMSKDKEIDKLMALISLSINKGTGYDNQRAVNVSGARENVGTPVVQKSGIQCYNCKEYGHVSRECHKPKRVKDAAYYKEKILLCKQEKAGVQFNEVTSRPVGQFWEPIFDDEPMHKVTPISLLIFDDDPTHKVQNNNDNYNVFARENEHPEQPDSSNDIYLAEHSDTNITIDSLDICYDRVQEDQDDTDDLDQERDLLASLI